MRRLLNLALIAALATVVGAGCGDDKKTNTGGEGEGEGAEGEGEGEGAEGEGEGEGTEGEGEGEGTEGEGEGEGTEGEGEGEGVEGEGEGEGEGGEDCQTCGTCQPAAGQLQEYGGWCGYTATCNPDSRTFPDCLSAQCKGPNGEEGFCLDGYCTRQCSVAADCQSGGGNVWVDGPKGSSFSCYGSAQFALCMAGTGDECFSDKECAATEACTIGYSHDFQHLIGTCITKTKCGSAPGGPCNDDPAAGALIPCENGLCFGESCNRICDGDADCDWSGALECKEDISVATGDFENDLFAFCFGKTCEKDVDCGDETAFWCNPLSLNTAGDALEGFCTDVTPGAASGYGEACTDDSDCSRGVCIGDTCAGGCKVEADCGEGFTCMDVSICIETNAAGACIDSLDQGFCLPWPGSRTDCTADVDCTTAGEHCALFSIDEAAGEISFKCRENYDGNAFGEECGGAQDIACYNDLCLSVPNEVGFCSQFCQTDEQCGAGFVCDDILISEDGTTTKVCMEWPGSATDCQTDADCTTAGEHCALANIDEEASTVIFRCRTNEEAGIAFGQACDLTGDDNVCYNDYCFGMTGEPGYCSRPCEVSADCGEGFRCLQIGVSETSDLTTGFCLQLEGSLNDCAADFTCPANETCTPTPQSDVLEFLCVTATGEALAGAECTSAEDCITGACFYANGSTGYCSPLCSETVTCGEGQNCVQMAVESGETPRTSGRCARTSECHICDTDLPCAGGFSCNFTEFVDGLDVFNIGTCVKPCTVDADCSDAPAGETATTCAALTGADGEPTGAMGCVTTDLLLDCGYLTVAE